MNTFDSTSTLDTLTVGDRVFHQKFGYGRVIHVDANKLTVDFDKAGEKRVIDSFVERGFAKTFFLREFLKGDRNAAKAMGVEIIDWTKLREMQKAR